MIDDETFPNLRGQPGAAEEPAVTAEAPHRDARQRQLPPLGHRRHNKRRIQDVLHTAREEGHAAVAHWGPLGSE